MTLDTARITYVAAVAGGWICDYRDDAGDLVETGFGPTRAEALAHMVERAGRQA